MLDKFRNTLKHTAIYSLGNLSLKAIGLILLPLYTTHLSVNDYGALALLEITSMLIVSILSFKLSTSMMRWCSVEKDNNRQKELVFTTYLFSIFIIILINALTSPFHSGLSNLFFNSRDFGIYFLILVASASIEILNYFPLELIRMREKSLMYISIVLVRLALILSLTIYLIVYKHLGIKGVLIAQLIGQIGVYFLTLPFLLRNIKFRIDFKELKAMLAYGIPLSFTAIAMMLLTVGDRFLIKYYLNYAEVGVYSLGYKIASVLNMFVIQSFTMGFLPVAYRMFDKPEAGRFFSKTLTYLVLVMVMLGMLLSIFSKELIEGFSRNADYYIAYKIVPFIVFAFTLKGIQYVFSLGLHFVKKTKYNAIIVLSVAVINIGLNSIFIPYFKIYGAAITTIICWVIMAIVFHKIANKLYPVKYEVKKIIMLLSLYVVVVVVSSFTDSLSLQYRLIIKTALFIFTPLLLLPLKFLEPVEKDRLIGAWHKWRRISKWPEYFSRIKLK